MYEPLWSIKMGLAMNALSEKDAHAQALELQAGLAHLQSICGDDPELLADMIEGELSVESFLSKLIAMITEDEADALGLKLYRDKISNRKKRLEERARRLRVLLASLVACLPSRRFRNELASVRVFDIDPSVIVDEEADVPSSSGSSPSRSLTFPPSAST